MWWDKLESNDGKLSRPDRRGAWALMAGLLLGSLAVVSTTLFPAPPGWDNAKFTRRSNRFDRPRPIARVTPNPIADPQVLISAQSHSDEHPQPGKVTFTRRKDLVAPHIKAVRFK